MESLILPSHLVPSERWISPDLSIKFDKKVEVHDDRKNMHIGKTIKVSDFKDRKKVDEWMYFHALISNSFEIIDYNENANTYELRPFKKGDSRKVIGPFDYDDIGREVYRIKLGQKIKYREMYNQYTKQSNKFRSCVKNYFLAQSIKSHSARIRTIDISYWQVNMYVSILEVLLGDMPFCDNELSCEVCGSELGNHYKVGTNKWIKQELLGKIEDDDVRKQYKNVIKICRNAIRHKSIHEGLMPSAKNPKLAEGSHEYAVGRAVKEYKDDKYAQFMLVDTMRQIVRYKILSTLAGSDIFPPLWSHKVHSIVLRANTPRTIKA